MKISILLFCFVLAGCQSTVLNLDETEDMLYTRNLSTEPGLKLKGMINQGVASVNTNMVGEVRSGYLLSMLAGYGNHQMVSLLLAKSIQDRKKINRTVYLDTLETAFLQNQFEITGALLDYARATNLSLSPEEFSNIVGGAGQRPGIPDTSYVLLKEYMSEMNRKKESQKAN